MVIAVDFDGTCVTHEYPEIGKDIGAAEVLKYICENDHKIILYTMRDNTMEEGRWELNAAIDWFEDRKIPLFGVNRNMAQTWSTSRKVYANYYIDDAALGTPLKNGHVDWVAMVVLLLERGILTDKQADSLLSDKHWMDKTNQ